MEIKDIITKLVDFLISDKYIYLGLMFEGKTNELTYDPVIGMLFKICDYIEKF